MHDVLKIAIRNLLRYRRRTLLTMALIMAGMVFVLVFASVTGSFKEVMVTNITDSYLAHLQIHRTGYQAAIDSIPLHLNLGPEQAAGIREVLASTPGIKAFSERVKFGAAFSNFQQTTNIRLNGVDPAAEVRTCPLLISRILQGEKDLHALDRGKILVPELLARGLNLKAGDTAVVVATNEEGSVNGKTFVVSGILSSVTGPGGRDGYLHIEDARELLRMSSPQVSEIAVALRDLSTIEGTSQRLRAGLAAEAPRLGKGAVELHTWKQLSPFAHIVRMIDIMTIFVKLMLVSIVLISILNVMVMAVYERIREIGTIAAMGTLPRRILYLFITEGLLLGVLGAVSGVLLGLGIIALMNVSKISFAFGVQDVVVLAPAISLWEVLLTSSLVIGIALLGSLQPAWKASKMEPVRALKHV